MEAAKDVRNAAPELVGWEIELHLQQDPTHLRAVY